MEKRLSFKVRRVFFLKNLMRLYCGFTQGFFSCSVARTAFFVEKDVETERMLCVSIWFLFIGKDENKKIEWKFSTSFFTCIAVSRILSRR